MTTFDSLRTAALALALALSACATAGDDLGTDTTQAEASSPAHFDLWSDEGAWYFHVASSSGEIVLASEGYTSRIGALGGILSVLDNGTVKARYHLSTGQDGQSYVTLSATNGQVIATTEGYSTASNARRGIDASIASLTSYVAAWTDATGARFEVFEGADDQFYFNLYAGNGEVVLRSEGYQSEAGALNGAFATAQYGVDASFYQVLESADGGHYVRLRAPNNEVVAVGEVYASKSGAESARAAMIALLPTIELL
jgi:uncharacterized protein YegP (UPF0339 family)